jgi:glycerophosphoryl diester phosphodiesterase
MKRFNTKFKPIFLLIFILGCSIFFSSLTEKKLTTKNALKTNDMIKTNHLIYLNKSDDLNQIKIIAHRADYYNEPENSLAGIRSCISHKVDYAEIDVQETKDGVVVLMHDYNLKRLTGLNKTVDQLNFNQLRTLNIHSHGSASEKIPTLQQVVNACNGKLNLIIEIKPYGNTNDLTRKVVNIMEQNNIVKTSMVHSLSYRILLNVKRLDPNISTGYIATGPVKNMALMNVNFFSIKQNILTQNLVTAIHQSNKRVFAWTVDNGFNMKNVINLHVDGVITNTPPTLKNLLKQNTKQIHKV